MGPGTGRWTGSGQWVTQMAETYLLPRLEPRQGQESCRREHTPAGSVGSTSCGATTALLPQRQESEGAPGYEFTCSGHPFPREGEWREDTRRRLSSCAWRKWKGLAAVVGYVTWSAAEGRKAPSRNGFARDREIVPQPRGHVGTPHRRGQEPVLVGPQGTGGTLSPLPSAKQPVAGTPPATPARLTVPFPGPWGHPQSSCSSRTKGPLLCCEPLVPCPAPQKHGKPGTAGLQLAELCSTSGLVPLLCSKKPVLEPGLLLAPHH